MFEIVLSFGCAGCAIVPLRPAAVSHGSCVSPNISRMKRPSAIVDSDIRDDIANASIASSSNPADW